MALQGLTARGKAIVEALLVEVNESLPHGWDRMEPLRHHALYWKARKHWQFAQVFTRAYRVAG